MGKIRILPDSIASKIAAGEVVERPAAVVKELVENSLDAGASRLRVDVEAGGRRLIRVLDDGCGMGHDDALLAFERHATSKLRQAEDLLSVSTLGFRGEALPSIAAVSRLVLETRAAEEAAGTRVEIHGGRMIDVKEAGLPTGTVVTARDLFYNLPARRKFLRSEATEMSHVASLVTHYALANPERGFVLSTSTGELLNVAPAANRRERFFQVFGGETLDQMVDLNDVTMEFPAYFTGTSSHLKGYTPEFGAGAPPEPEPGVVLRLSGFISRPQVQKANRNAIFIFVNRRLIRDRLLLHALSEAYRNVIPSGTFPVALLFLEMPCEEVDVNVHPSKTEVRFRHQNVVHDFLRDGVLQRLRESRPVSTFPVTAPPDVTQPVPVMAAASAAGPAFHLEPPRPLPEPGRLSFGTVPLPEPETREEALVQESAEPTAPVRNPQLEGLRPLGQLHDSFIVAASAEGLWIIDQHVAHERVLFEQVLARRSKRERLEGQQLLMPFVLRLTPAQQVAFGEVQPELEAHGFEMEPFGHSTVAVKAAPAGVSAQEMEKLLREVLDHSAPEIAPDAAPNAATAGLEDLQRRVAASVACHAAIKVNMRLEQRKMEWLLGALARTECPMTCPHGRPVVLRYSMRDILKAFHRI